ncbi:hypothetical protein [Methylomicrobium sp. Wu6]|uniref:hypothetical protein n=1 Tax=Methylomicrobium sp. Wu6 TaxID=3107928 RepID=UPI002DD67B5B|nr:hypothetical protein [Methylomicrobium sp. Wu6]MEC4749260.1 hypothetical protein [Methylomicrobium sp. Wu6]
MSQIPGPEEILGSQGLTREDQDYQGSRFSDVKAALFANPYQKVWGGPNEPALPYYKTTNKSTYAGILPGGQPPQFTLAAIRALESSADLRWGEDGRGFRRLLRPNGVCALGTWQIDEDNPYTGYFKKGSQGLAVARISAGVTKTCGGIRRSYGLFLKIFPTLNENHKELLSTANVILADDLGGTTTTRINGVELTNAPHVTGLNRGNELPTILQEGVLFLFLDLMPSVRQVYPIAELGKPAGIATHAPEFMRLRMAPGIPLSGENDLRDEVMSYIFDKGNPLPLRTLSFDISASDTGKRSGFALLPKGERQSITNWQTIGKVNFNNAVVSYNGDFVINFRHPLWRKDRNDPDSALRKGGKRVRW